MDPRPPFLAHPLPPPPIPGPQNQYTELSPQSIPPQHLPPQQPPLPQSLPQPLPPQQLPPQPVPPPPIPPQQLPPQQPFIPLINPQAAAPDNGPDSSDPPSAKRRRTSAAGSRGVSTLTPEQLAKKRANDREAQRAIRERTKAQIETLEKKIEELSAQKPHQELQDVLRQKQIVEAENVDIKRRLETVMSVLQPVLGLGLGQVAPVHGSPSNGLLTPTITTSQPPIPPNPPPPEYAASRHSSNGLATPAAINRLSQGPNTTFPPQTYDGGSVRSSTSAASNYPSPSNLKQTPPMNFPPQPGFQPINNIVRHSSSQGSLPNRSQDDKLALEFLMQSRHSSRDSQSQRERTASTTIPCHFPMDTLTRPPPNLSYGTDLPMCAMPIRNCPPTGPLDSLLLDFLADKRKQAINGLPIPDIVGPAYPSFTSLVIAARRPYTHALSKVFTDMLATFPDISTLPEQVAILHMMFLMMRYCLNPTQENYDRLPTWFQPRPSQLLIAHPTWVDYLPWPKMRDTMCTVYPSIPFDDFFIPYTTTVSLNWPFDPSTVLIPATAAAAATSGMPSASSIPSAVLSPDKPPARRGAVSIHHHHHHQRSPNTPHHPHPHPPLTSSSAAPLPQTNTSTSSPSATSASAPEELLLNPAFEKHLLDLGNWSLGPAFKKTHPRLADGVIIRDKDAASGIGVGGSMTPSPRGSAGAGAGVGVGVGVAGSGGRRRRRGS